MNSKNLVSVGFKKWVAFKPMDKKKFNEKEFPEETGVYIIRLEGGKPVKRLKGESDIIKIGQTKNIKKRMWAYLNPNRNLSGPKKVTARRIRRPIDEEGYKFEVAFRMVSDKDASKRIQGGFLKKYEDEHLELPPLNSGKF